VEERSLSVSSSLKKYEVSERQQVVADPLLSQSARSIVYVLRSATLIMASTSVRLA